jgi:Phosphotransferase enzyme family
VLGGALRDLEPQLLARLAPGEWRVTQRTMEPTRYRTELGAALKHTLQARDATGRAATVRCFVKVYRNDHGEHTFQLLQSLGRRAERGETRYSVVRPVAYRKDLRTLVLEEAPGTALQQLLRDGHDPAGPLRRTARAVAAFNRDDLGTAELRRSSRAVQLEELRRAGAIVEWARPELGGEVRAITAAVAAGLDDVPLAPIHGDLKPDHVFLAGDRVIFIDLDSVVLGDPVRDPAHLCAYVAGRVGLDAVPAEEARVAAALFAAEYFEHVPAEWRPRFRLHCAGALVEVASAIFRRQEAHWPEKVAAAVAAARGYLG